MIDFLKTLDIWKVFMVITMILSLYTLFKKNRGGGETNIMALIKAIHSPKNTQASWVRWASSMVILLTFALAFYQQKANGSVQETLVISLIGLALGSKVAQKAIETRNKNKENEDEIE